MSDSFYEEHLKNLEWMRGVCSVTIEYEHKSRELQVLDMQVGELEDEIKEKQREAEKLRQWIAKTDEGLKPKETKRNG